MKFSINVKPVGYLKNNLADILKDTSESRCPMQITQNGEAKLVVMEVKSYEEQAEMLAMLKILALSNREIELGKFRPVEDVFSDLDRSDR